MVEWVGLEECDISSPTNSANKDEHAPSTHEHTQLLLNSLALWLAMFSVSRVNSSSPSRESGCCRCCCGDGCRGDVEDCVTCDLCILSCCLTCSLYGES